MNLALKPFLILACVMAILAGCRSLTVNETEFANKIYSDVVDLEPVRLHRISLWRGHTEESIRTELSEDLIRNNALAEHVVNKEAFLNSALKVLNSQAEAVVLGNNIYYLSSTYKADFAPGFPNIVNVTELGLLAHELVHVWQHQNRCRTGYSLLAIALERLRIDKPYEYQIVPGKSFLDYRFEQQGAIMQTYVMLAFSTADPEALRQHRELLEQEFDLKDFRSKLLASTRF